MIHEIHGQYQLFTRRIDLWFLDRKPGLIEELHGANTPATLFVAKPMTFEPLLESVIGPGQPATCSLQPDAAQFLMDELWRLGCRPTQAAGSAGQLSATEKHLEDMRSLVFKFKVETTMG